MKKRNIALTALFATLLSGCAGKTYTYEESATAVGVTTSIKYELKIMASTFSLSADTSITGVGTAVSLAFGGSFESTLKEKHSGVCVEDEDREGVYKLVTTKIVVSGFTCEGDGSAAYKTVAKESLKTLTYLSSSDISDIIDGKSVAIELEEDKYTATYVEVNEDGTFKPTYGA